MSAIQLRAHMKANARISGFNHDDQWGHRAGEPNKAVICSIALARLRTDIRGDNIANSNAVGMAQKLLLFWRKPARRCWWEGVELEGVDGIEGKLKVWIRRVWTLEMVSNGPTLALRYETHHWNRASLASAERCFCSSLRFCFCSSRGISLSDSSAAGRVDSDISMLAFAGSDTFVATTFSAQARLGSVSRCIYSALGADGRVFMDHCRTFQLRIVHW